ncbi:nucleolar protein 58-like [Palaemon carinicauda]|uniref:nucleolar protein 58-like n=1 Tax=Palaemon carinicauda TaxID=392227 RepID=UPI0035B602C5
MGQINLEMSEQLERAKNEKVASIHQLESVFEEKIDKLEQTIEKQLGIIREMKTEKEGLEMNLTEAKTKNLTNEGNYTCLVNKLKDTKKEARRAKDELSMASVEIGKLKKSMASIAKQLEGRDKKKEVSRHGTRKVRLNRSSLEISTEKDVKKDVQKDVSVNKEDEDKVGKAAEDLDANGHKEEKEVVGEASGVGQVLSWLLTSKGALPDNDHHQDKQKLQKETSPSEEEEEEEEKEKKEEEKEKGEKEKEKNEKEEEEKIVEKKPVHFYTRVFSIKYFLKFICYYGITNGSPYIRSSNFFKHYASFIFIWSLF